jgi:hypothetical protein
MHKIACTVILLTLLGPLHSSAQDTSSKHQDDEKPSAAAAERLQRLEDEVQQQRALIERQQAEIDQLLAQDHPSHQPAPVPVEAVKPPAKGSQEPAAIRYKGITLTPGGFLEAASMVRTRNENADVIGNFSAIPFDGTANSHLSEFRASARGSRFSLLAEGLAGSTKLTGYYEIDFLGQAPTANQVETNSFTPRQRQLWGQAEFSNGLTFTAGQMWSLLTTDRKGVATRAEFIPLTIDGAYVVGYDYVRQTSFRFTKKFQNKYWAAVELANPETSQPNASYVPSNLFGFNSSTNATSPSGATLNYLSGSTNGFSTNLAPDLLAKFVWEPGWGHYEIKALGRFFRDRISGNTTVVPGGGLGAAATLPLGAKKADFTMEGLIGNGIGRYGAANGPDVTLRPDGWIIPIHALHLMAALEFHPQPKLDLYLYGGNEYYGRAAYVNPDSPAHPAGYGSTLVTNTNCNLEVIPTDGIACGAQNKDVAEGTAGFWYRVYKGPAGTFQLGTQYGYLHRTAWSGVGGAPQGGDNLVMTSLRYCLP